MRRSSCKVFWAWRWHDATAISISSICLRRSTHCFGNIAPGLQTSAYTAILGSLLLFRHAMENRKLQLVMPCSKSTPKICFCTFYTSTYPSTDLCSNRRLRLRGKTPSILVFASCLSSLVAPPLRISGVWGGASGLCPIDIPTRIYGNPSGSASLPSRQPQTG